ncbi:hypothetical protein [Oryzihumus leptocrescens]|uniref:Uncharacterized protein n=1 Tax=Oryzihumus leptocrescens TaxID=297536 RepID=A0A542ZEK7_9MICO|nr:hypothetical protein [Oryzihumus leptocrescens]TQL58768.1 hypothetical protein FB474_0105 [Oryzihumus leptocrescens]
MLRLLGAHIGVTLQSERIHLPDGAYVDVDGVCTNPPALVEAWAHQGPPKSAQRNKILGDALKLAHVNTVLGTGHRLILCFSDEAACAPFTGRSWYAGAIRTLGIETHVVTLPDNLVKDILAAQQRQYR